MIYVYHIKSEFFREIPHFGDDEEMRSFVKLNVHNYKLVARVDTDDLDVAYKNTNHIDISWTENEGVAVLTKDRVRSTSVGDFVRHNNKTFIVARFGFLELT